MSFSVSYLNPYTNEEESIRFEVEAGIMGPAESLRDYFCVEGGVIYEDKSLNFAVLAPINGGKYYFGNFRMPTIGEK